MRRWYALRGAIILAVVVFCFVAILVDAALAAAGDLPLLPMAGDVAGIACGATAGVIVFRRSRQCPNNAVPCEQRESLAAVGQHSRGRANLVTSAIVAIISASLLCYLALDPPSTGDRKAILGVHSLRTIVLTYLGVAFVLACSVMDLFAFVTASRQRSLPANRETGD